jgi:hypothetical protein
MDLFDTLTWAEILEKTTFLGTPTLTVLINKCREIPKPTTCNTVPTWLLPCHYNNRCQCNARLRPDIICIKPLPHLSEQTPSINDEVTIQFIEFTYYHDRIFEDKIQIKKDK